MYLADLSASEKVAFLCLARHMVARDGKLQSEEQELLQALSNEMGIPVDLAEDMGYLEAVTVMDTHKARRIALLELIGLACTDGRYHVQEKQFIDELAHSFDVAPEEVTAAESFINRLSELIREGERLLM